RFRELQIEPPTRGRVERLIRSAIALYETDFAEHKNSCINISISESLSVNNLSAWQSSQL
ncbi:MAG: hypothetical protein RLZZ69_2908, partial [Cyanobacteriota bacterium]